MGHVFISYSRKDKVKAVRLYEDLKFRGLSAWIDFQDIQPGTAWSDEIGQAILESSHFLLLLSPEAIKSDYVRREYEYALEHNHDVLPLLLEPCQMPQPIARLQYIDFEEYQRGLDRLLKVFPADSYGKTHTANDVMDALKSSSAELRATAMVLV